MCSVMPSGHPSPLNEVDHQDHDGDDEQDMDEAAHRVRGDHSESPEDQEDHEDCPKHGISFLPWRSAEEVNDSGRISWSDHNAISLPACRTVRAPCPASCARSSITPEALACRLQR